MVVILFLRISSKTLNDTTTFSLQALMVQYTLIRFLDISPSSRYRVNDSGAVGRVNVNLTLTNDHKLA